MVHKTGIETLAPTFDILWDTMVTDIDMNMLRLGDLLKSKRVVLFVNVATK